MGILFGSIEKYRRTFPPQVKRNALCFGNGTNTKILKNRPYIISTNKNTVPEIINQIPLANGRSDSSMICRSDEDCCHGMLRIFYVVENSATHGESTSFKLLNKAGIKNDKNFKINIFLYKFIKFSFFYNI